MPSAFIGFRRPLFEPVFFTSSSLYRQSDAHCWNQPHMLVPDRVVFILVLVIDREISHKLKVTAGRKCVKFSPGMSTHR